MFSFPGRTKKVIIVGIKEAEQSLHGQLVSGKVIASGLDEELSKEATRAAAAERQRLAKEVASALKLSVAIDTSLSE
ncbi:haloacid dehalogenase-like hydrolase, partial [Trifolium medium]|nr:haloacid dehalogenase-like hydrolase [Trifolium medium]